MNAMRREVNSTTPDQPRASRSTLSRTSELSHSRSTGRKEQYVSGAFNLDQGIVELHFSSDPPDVLRDVREFWSVGNSGNMDQ